MFLLSKGSTQKWPATTGLVPSWPSWPRVQVFISFCMTICTKVNHKYHNSSTPASLEFINRVSVQIVLTIPTWISCIRAIQIAHQRKWKDRGRRPHSKTQLSFFTVTMLVVSQTTDACSGTLLLWRCLNTCLPMGPSE